MGQLPKGFKSVTLKTGKTSFPLSEGDSITGTPLPEVKKVTLPNGDVIEKLQMKLADGTIRECDPHAQLKKAWVQFVGKSICIVYTGKEKIKGIAQPVAQYEFGIAQPPVHNEFGEEE